MLQSSSKTAYIFNGNDLWKNINFIKDKITEKYPGNWLISIFYPTNSTPVKPGETFSVSSSPVDGEWWIYWKGPNHYQADYAYILSRID